ncbi:MAG TPA: peptidoglycan DD-metalloendopeptidase family protein [Gammaproteobacteria bacterium]|nr:peptidoglycan DD-metalloendopeptidase family protein [Gammaproteobacteria bacterium]
MRAATVSRAGLLAVGIAALAGAAATAVAAEPQHPQHLVAAPADLPGASHRAGNGLRAPGLAAPARVAGRIRHSLYRAARKAGLSRELTGTLIGIFARRVDYRHDIQAGDRFVVVYDDSRDEPRIIAAELDVRGKALHAFRYTDGNGQAAWYSLDGQPFKPTLLRTPVNYIRVSSPFSHRRLNPVLHIYRPHYGVDLAAPAGTPVRAAGDGRVTFRDRDGGYGKLIIIDNPGPYSTRYGHMSRFAKGIHVGSHVRQGEVIGYVGATGVATGPHLHFEIRVNGKPHPPLKIDLPREQLSGKALLAYEKAIAPLTAALDPTPRRPAGVEVAAAGGDPGAAPPARKGPCALGAGDSLAMCLLRGGGSDGTVAGGALSVGLAVRP